MKKRLSSEKNCKNCRSVPCRKNGEDQDHCKPSSFTILRSLEECQNGEDVFHTVEIMMSMALGIVVGMVVGLCVSRV